MQYSNMSTTKWPTNVSQISAAYAAVDQVVPPRLYIIRLHKEQKASSILAYLISRVNSSITKYIENISNWTKKISHVSIALVPADNLRRVTDSQNIYHGTRSNNVAREQTPFFLWLSTILAANETSFFLVPMAFYLVTPKQVGGCTIPKGFQVKGRLHDQRLHERYIFHSLKIKAITQNQLKMVNKEHERRNV